jgi:hypothetical protein
MFIEQSSTLRMGTLYDCVERRVLRYMEQNRSEYLRRYNDIEIRPNSQGSDAILTVTFFDEFDFEKPSSYGYTSETASRFTSGAFEETIKPDMGVWQMVREEEESYRYSWMR